MLRSSTHVDVPTHVERLPSVCDSAPDLDQVYVAHAPLLRNIALGRFRVGPADAEALVHDVFATYLQRHADIVDVRGYLVAGICQASRRFWERQNRQVPLDESTELVSDANRSSDQTHARIEIALMLARLDPRCREILKRVYLLGESPADLAAESQTSLDNMYVVLCRCRRRARGNATPNPETS
jgi:RNA polymerase sigma factor (sigma-70 family)